MPQLLGHPQLQEDLCHNQSSQHNIFPLDSTMFLCVWQLHQISIKLTHVWIDLSHIPNQLDHITEKAMLTVK